MSYVHTETLSIPATSANVKIIGSVTIPAVSYGGDSLSYNGPIDQLFFDVEGWDTATHSPIGKLPSMYKNYSALFVQVQNGRGKIIKAFVAKIVNIFSYDIDPNNGYVDLKIAYKEVSIAGQHDYAEIPPTIAHILTDPESDLIALILEGDYNTCVEYAHNKLDTFQHGSKLYYNVSVSQYSVRYDRTADGTELYQNMAVFAIAYPEVPAPDITRFTGRIVEFLKKVYGGVNDGNS